MKLLKHCLPGVIGIFLVAVVSAQEANTRLNPVLQAELLELRRIDQDALRDKTLSSEDLSRLQIANTTRLQTIIEKHGWPTLSMVGNDAAQGAWLIVQHADNDRAWQRYVLTLMESQVPSNEVRKSDVAYLRDRLAVSESSPQRYGTQGKCVAKDVWQPFEIADPEYLEERRAKMGMSTEEVYLARASLMCANFKPK